MVQLQILLINLGMFSSEMFLHLDLYQLQFDTDYWETINNGNTKKIIIPKDLK